jgi:hypothetical protein
MSLIFLNILLRSFFSLFQLFACFGHLSIKHSNAKNLAFNVVSVISKELSVFNFNSLPFFDNHTHLINYEEKDGKQICLEKTELEPYQLAIPFLHGFRDVPPADGKGAYSPSPELRRHAANFGVVKTMINYLSQYLGCEPTLEALTAARNEYTRKDLADYTKKLYEDQHIICEMADLPNPMNDRLLQQCFPVKLLRLFQMDPLFRRLLKENSDLDQFMKKYFLALRKAASEGFAGIKCHVFELVTCEIYEVDRENAESMYAGAKRGEESAFNGFYLYVFAQTLLLSQELNIPVHIHTGCTGDTGNGLIGNCDPFLICPFLNDIKYRFTKIVFLHSSVPEIRKAALLTHSYPNIWVDLSWTLPWTNINFAQCLEEVLGLAPWDKILLGTGQHEIPEMVWCASKIAKSALAFIMDKSVYMNLISVTQAQEAAEMILYRNALGLYGLQI